MRDGTAGRRFVDLYEARRTQAKCRWTRVAILSAGVILVLLGPIAAIVPGPGGILLVALGLALLASELRPVARSLDWFEPKLHTGARRVRSTWRRSRVFRFALVVLGLAMLGACMALGAWKLG